MFWNPQALLVRKRIRVIQRPSGFKFKPSSMTETQAGREKKRLLHPAGRKLQKCGGAATA